MLRICYCLSHYYPIASGAERQAHLQAIELVRRGHRVHVVTRAISGWPEREQRDGVAICRLIRTWELGPVFGLSFVASLSRALRQLRDEFDLVHCHQGLWEATAAGIVAPRLAKPSIVQPAAGGNYGEIHQLARTHGRTMLRKLILRNTHFVAISGQIQRELADLGVPRERVSRLASGVNTDAFSPGPSTLEEQLPPRPRILFLGRLHPQKNLHTLLAAWPEVRKHVPAALVLAGEGPELHALRAQAESLDCANSICFPGAVNNPVDYLRAADVFVLPSHAEGMSNSLLEAMAVGLPVLASNIGGNADLVHNGDTGLLLEPDNVGRWSQAIIQLMDDPARGKRLGAAARDLVQTRFSIQTIVDQYVQLYERLI